MIAVKGKEKKSGKIFTIKYSFRKLKSHEIRV